MKKKNNILKNEILGDILESAACYRAWEAFEKKGYDPNETRMTDILECWIGESGPALGLIGIPFDSAVYGRKGAKGGPKKIRDSIRYYKAYDWEEDFWFGDQIIYDFGDLIFETDSVLESHEKISFVIEKISSKKFSTITLGGDHSIAYPIVKGISQAQRGKKIGLINIDAHLDVREIIGDKISSGTPFRRLIDDGIIDGKNFVEIGIRNFANAKKYRQYVENANGTIHTIESIRKLGLDEIISKTIKQISKDTDITYLSVDMDSLDQIYAPGVSAPTPDGLNPYQILKIIQQVMKNTNLVGMDIVELNPLYDTADTTAINAANFLVQFASSYFLKRKINY
ncbi:MAG: formimidoylglutamase [Candidatus Heimdallarchaeota archaeon]|nr:formimidoylglutamase [Candidatus Heimdallarchaeota archaeon]